MLRRWWWILPAVMWCACGWAQSHETAEVFGGYSFAVRDFASGTNPISTMPLGWNASVNLKATRLIGIVADVAGYRLSQNFCSAGATSCSANGYTLMFGPQFSWTGTKVTPFVHALFGLAHASQNGTSPPDPFRGNNSPVFALGGGLDYHLTARWALRGQADYFHTGFTYSDNQLSYNNSNARISAGVVVRF